MSGKSRAELRAELKSDFELEFSGISEEIYRIAYVYLKNREDALDVVQETAYKCYKNIGKLRDRRLFKTWAVRTAINCSLDRLRKDSRLIRLDDAAEPAEPHDLEGEALSRITLTDLMERLEPLEKSMILLKYEYGLTFAEAAEFLKIPLGTAKSVCYRAVSKLKEGL